MHRGKGKKNNPKEIVKEIMQMHYEKGITTKEIAVRLCMPYKTVKNTITRENNKKKDHSALKIPLHRGRPRKAPITREHAMELRIKELEREVELYKSFLQAAGRM